MSQEISRIRKRGRYGQDTFSSSPEVELSPETIYGSSYKVPVIEGNGTGRGFIISDHALPIGWANAEKILKTKNEEFYQGRFEWQCEENGLKAGKVSFDKKSGLLYRLDMQSPSVSAQLVGHYENLERGVYEVTDENDSPEIPSLEAAFVIHRLLTVYINSIRHEIGEESLLPYIDGGFNPNTSMGTYYSMYMDFPRSLLEEEVQFNDHFKFRGQMAASNTAGRFGFTARDIMYNDKGLPVSFGVHEGSACEYYLPHGEGTEYSAHNVDTLRQAAALHGMAGEFINHAIMIFGRSTNEDSD